MEVIQLVAQAEEYINIQNARSEKEVPLACVYGDTAMHWFQYLKKRLLKMWIGKHWLQNCSRYFPEVEQESLRPTSHYPSNNIGWRLCAAVWNVACTIIRNSGRSFGIFYEWVKQCYHKVKTQPVKCSKGNLPCMIHRGWVVWRNSRWCSKTANKNCSNICKSFICTQLLNTQNHECQIRLWILGITQFNHIQVGPLNITLPTF